MRLGPCIRPRPRVLYTTAVPGERLRGLVDDVEESWSVCEDWERDGDVEKSTQPSWMARSRQAGMGKPHRCF